MKHAEADMLKRAGICEGFIMRCYAPIKNG